MPSPTYLVFSSVTSFGDFDKAMAADAATMKAATEEERNTLEKFSADGLINTETVRFRLDPVMSYVPREVRAQDPAFWIPKPKTTARTSLTRRSSGPRSPGHGLPCPGVLQAFDCCVATLSRSHFFRVSHVPGRVNRDVDDRRPVGAQAVRHRHGQLVQRPDRPAPGPERRGSRGEVPACRYPTP